MSTLAQLIRQACDGNSSGWEELFKVLDDLMAKVYQSRFKKFSIKEGGILQAPDSEKYVVSVENQLELFQVTSSGFYDLCWEKIWIDNFSLLRKCLDSVSDEDDEQIKKWLYKTLQRVLEEEIRRNSPVASIWKKVQRIFSKRPELWQKEEVVGDTVWRLVDYEVTPTPVELKDLLEVAKGIPLPPVKWVWKHEAGIKRPQMFDADLHDFLYALFVEVGGRIKKNVLIDLLAHFFSTPELRQKSSISEKKEGDGEVYGLISNLPDESQGLFDTVIVRTDLKEMAVKSVALMNDRGKFIYYQHHVLGENKQEIACFLKVSNATITKENKKLLSRLKTQFRDEADFTDDDAGQVLAQIAELLREEFSE